MSVKELPLGRRNQITIPKEFVPRGATIFHCEKKPDGTIILIPHVSIPASQTYFWTKRWQEGEKKASEDIAEGRLRRHLSADALISRLVSRRKK